MGEIEKLARLLDERGVDHSDASSGTVMWVDARGRLCLAAPEIIPSSHGERIVVRQSMTAAEAIALTLDGATEDAILRGKKPAGSKPKAAETEAGRDEGTDEA